MDPLGLQRQIQNNSTDLLDFCNDLKQWGEEMKRKDEQLKSGEDMVDANVQIPRNKVKRDSKESKSKPEKPKVKSKRVKPYDFWEKLDVDAECAKVDEDNNDDSGELTDEFDETTQSEAYYEKEKGNKFVKNQNWDSAIECYTKAIECYGYDPIFYANRALCYLKKQNYRAAEADCTSALKLDSKYVKAYQRRAAAREALNQLTDAHADLMKVFDYEPNNKESKAALAKLEKKLENFKTEPNIKKAEVQRPKSKFTISRQQQKENKLQSSQNQVTAAKNIETVKTKITNNSNETIVESPKFKTYWPSGNEVELIQAVYKPPHLRSKKRLKRISIQNIDTLISNTGKQQIQNTVVAQPWPKPESESQVIKCDDFKIIERKVEDHKEEERNSRENCAKSVFATEKMSNKSSKFVKSRNNRAEDDSNSENDSNGAHASDSLSREYMKKHKSRENHKETKTEDFDITKCNEDSGVNVRSKGKLLEVNEEYNSDSENDDGSYMYGVPQSATEFDIVWRVIRFKQKQRFELLKLLDPTKFRDYFKATLESDVFGEILYTLARYFIRNNLPVYEFLWGLSEVERFDMLVMLMTRHDKGNLMKLARYMRTTTKYSTAELQKLLSRYNF